MSGCRRSQVFTTWPRFFCVSSPWLFIFLKISPQPSCDFMAVICSSVSGCDPLVDLLCPSKSARATFWSPGESLLICAHALACISVSARTAPSSAIRNVSMVFFTWFLLSRPAEQSRPPEAAG